MEFIIAAAVTCEDKSVYVGWIMNMEEVRRVVMKGIIQDSLGRLEDLEGEEEEDYDGEGLNESGFVEDSDGEAVEQNGIGFHSDDDDDGLTHDDEMSGLFRDAISQFNHVTEGMDMDVQFDSSSTSDLKKPSSGKMNKQPTISSDILRERDELRAALSEAKRELSSYQSQSKRMVEDTESSQKKLRALAEDLQERLEQRQNELVQVEDSLYKTKRSLEDAESKVEELTEKNATLEDELDIANAKASQLRKAEATLVAYRKKLEGVGVMNQQMTDLEDQSAKYLTQIMELEVETKKVPELQKKLDGMKRDFVRVQKEKNDATETMTAKVAEISKLKSELKASMSAKKMFEEELNELRTIQQDESQEAAQKEMDVGGLSLTSAKSISEVKEKAMRLEIENKNLKKQLGIDINAAIGSSMMIGTGSGANDATVAALEVEINELQARIKSKEKTIAKLSTDKDRLEAYTKKTLAKFQEKYLVALQECKAKLKEKHDKIEQLEVRSATEKSNQKREEKLLSSAMYELGLSIMQNKLKER